MSETISKLIRNTQYTILVRELITYSLQCGSLAVLSASVDAEIVTVGYHLADDFHTLGDVHHIMLVRATSARSIESLHILQLRNTDILCKDIKKTQ